MAAFLRRAEPFLGRSGRNAWENIANSLREQSFMSKAYFSTASQSFSTDGKILDLVFANYNIYKGKAALSTFPKLPQFSKYHSGSLKVDRKGSIMLQFSHAIGERKYDWEKAQFFALSPTEVGSLISLGREEACELFHDPSLQSSNAGQVRKTLQVQPHADGSGYFITLSVVNNILKFSERFTVPVTKAEFAVMRTAFSFALPRIMGWDRYINQPPKNIEENASMVYPRVKSLEWDR